MTRTASIALSTKGLKSANRVGRKDFQFISGSDTFVCDRFQAMFVSPRIATLIETDPTIDEFSLDHANSRSFETLEQLICGDVIVVNETKVKVLIDLIEDLGNLELSESVLTFIESKTELDVSNCISRLNWKMRLNVNIVSEIEFIATHLSDFRVDAVRDIEISIVEDILQQHSLRILNEDWLLKFIFELGSKYFGLIGYVRFEFLNAESIDLFFNTISIDELNCDIWEGMKNRMRHRLVYDRKESENS
jgi:hypothetical protein